MVSVHVRWVLGNCEVLDANWRWLHNGQYTSLARQQPFLLLFLADQVTVRVEAVKRSLVRADPDMIWLRSGLGTATRMMTGMSSCAPTQSRVEGTVTLRESLRTGMDRDLGKECGNPTKVVRESPRATRGMMEVLMAQLRGDDGVLIVKPTECGLGRHYKTPLIS